MMQRARNEEREENTTLHLHPRDLSEVSVRGAGCACGATPWLFASESQMVFLARALKLAAMDVGVQLLAPMPTVTITMVLSALGEG